MKPHTRTPPRSNPAPAPAVPAPAAPTAATKAAPPGERISFSLDADGKPDIERMHSKTKDKLAAWVKDPTVAKSLGVTSNADAPAGGEAIPADLVRACVSTLSQLNVILVSRMTGAPGHIVVALAPWTPAEQDAIVGPLGAVLNKYAPSALSKYGDEIALLFIVGSTVAKKVDAVKQAALAARPSAVPVPIRDDTAPAPEGQS